MDRREEKSKKEGIIFIAHSIYSFYVSFVLTKTWFLPLSPVTKPFFATYSEFIAMSLSTKLATISLKLLYIYIYILKRVYLENKYKNTMNSILFVLFTPTSYKMPLEAYLWFSKNIYFKLLKNNFFMFDFIIKNI